MPPWRSQGFSGKCTPRAEKKMDGAEFIGGKLQVLPHAEQEVKFLRKFLLGGKSWKVELWECDD